MAFVTKQGAAMGIVTLVANTIILQLAMLIAYGLDGFASAAETLVAEAKGKQSRNLFSNAFLGTLIWTAVVALLFCLFFFVAKPLLLGVMTSQTDILVMCEEFYIYIYLFCLTGAWSFWLDGIFIGVGKFKDMMLSMLISSGIVFLGLWRILQPLENHGLWLAYCGFLLSRSLSLGFMSYRYSKQNAWFKSA
jgi:MATE family multidrug resistance protein